MYTEKVVELRTRAGTLFLLMENLMEDWKEKIRRSDAGRARPDLAEELIAETNGAEVLELSPLVGSPSQVSRSPELSEKDPNE